MKISAELLKQVYAEAERTYPFEACGAVLGVAGSNREACEFRSFENRQNDFHQKDPVRYPRNAKTAYAIDSRDWQNLEKEAKEKGLEIISIFHSHPEHGVYFSEEDKNMACPWGEPLFPNQSYLVVSVYSGAVKNASEFIWNNEKKDFIEEKIL